MARKTFRTIQAEDDVLIGYRSHRAKCVFMGFSDWDEKYGDGGAKFANWAELAKAKGVSTFAELQAKQDEREHGFGCYAIFREQGDKFTAYLYNGRWCLGSSADVAKIGPVREDRIRRLNRALYGV